MADGRKHVHVVGTGRSGSTLLAFLANALDDVASVGEVTGPPESHPDPEGFICSCGQPLVSDPFWQDVGADLAARGHHFTPTDWDMRFATDVPAPARPLLERSLRSNLADDLRDRLVQRSPMGDRFAYIADRNVALGESVGAQLGARVVLDASKDVRRPVLLQRYRPDVDLRVLHLIRGPHGYVASRRKRRDMPVSASLREWTRNVGHCARLEARLGPDRFRRVRYEDMCTDPLGTLQALSTWMEVPVPAELPVADAHPHHIIGNKLRLTGVGEIRLDESWREELTAGEQATVTAATVTQRRLMGYR